MPKKVYTWGKVQAGDIISFRYKGKKPTGTLTTLLVFNPKLPYVKKDGTKTFHLVGLKLEDRGTIPMIKSKPMLVQLLERVGDIEVVSGDDQIYRIEIKNVGVRGVKKQTYTKLKQYIGRYSVYRTYDYIKARKSSVFLEPISLPKGLREVLIEN
jgi:hypothetical protein|tara:strand:+ start:1158 stop:1622 length:465 start_codon:yes stop_codon:yes gene_type:complete